MAENGPEHLKKPQLVLKYPQKTPRDAIVHFCMSLASFYSTPGKCPKSNAKIVARCENFLNSKFSLEIFWKVGFDLVINLQV